MEFNVSQLESVHNFYGNRLRTRACGLVVRDDRLLMLKHDLGKGDFWSPPGGGIQFGETALDCLKRELEEETGLIAENCDFLFACELLKQPLHVIELFFMVSTATGILNTGNDPENGAPSVILDARFLAWSEIAVMDKDKLHGIFACVSQPKQILDLRGYFTL
jgi:8-oxo-dGTP diphosphatase